MMNKLAASLVCAMILALVTGAASPAHASRNYYGDSARSVAKAIGCKDFTRHGGGEYNRDAGVCWVKSKRVNVLTFRGPARQSEWNGVAKFAFGARFWWAHGKGAIVVAKNGNKRAARIGADRLPGSLRHG